MSITTETLIANAAEEADLTNEDDFVTDAFWLKWLQSGVNSLHRRVTNQHKSTYWRTYDFTLTDGESLVTLPSNFYRLKGLDIDPETPRRRSVRPFNFADRNKYLINGLRSVETFDYTRVYNVLSRRQMKIEAEEQAAGNYRLYYVPKPKQLAAVRSITVENTDTVVAASRTWTFANGAFAFDETGNTFTIAGTDAGNDGTYTIESRTSATVVVSVESPAGNETFDGTETLSLTTNLDDELEPYAEYVWLYAAIKGLTKEESFAQAKLLIEQRELVVAELPESLEADGGGPATIIDTDEDAGDRW